MSIHQMATLAQILAAREMEFIMRAPLVKRAMKVKHRGAVLVRIWGVSGGVWDGVGL